MNRAVPVASIEAASAFTMSFPVLQAEPAELVPALRAGHVHAALILFYGPLALRTRLCVGDDPV